MDLRSPFRRARPIGKPGSISVFPEESDPLDAPLFFDKISITQYTESDIIFKTFTDKQEGKTDGSDCVSGLR
jgi:hypothetical protein